MTTEAWNHYNDPAVTAFCERKGVIPPPYWSPDGKSGAWVWDETRERVQKRGNRETLIGKGAWTWVPDESGQTLVAGMYVKSKKEEKGFIGWFKKIFRRSFSARRKN